MVEIDSILETLRLHNVPLKKLQEVEKAYKIAKRIHHIQKRKSGEPYIIHPLHVAQIILDMEIYDPDMISAALLHDTLEDSDEITKEDIAELINIEVAELVEGVTKLKNNNYSSNVDSVEDANVLKILEGFRKDVRIVILKLADRLHNMRTLEYMSPEKQIAKAQETKDVFVPLAIAIGAYRIKNELEDLALKYLEPENYENIVEKMNHIYLEKKGYLEEMANRIEKALQDIGISSKIIIRNKSISNVADALKNGYQLENIYDLFYLKILVQDERECYDALYIIHNMFPAINGRFKDYISNPRTNLYQSVHTTVSDADGNFLKIKIRTYDMDKVAAFGFPAIWDLKNETHERTQKEIVEKSQIVKMLTERDNTNISNREFMETVKQEGLGHNIYVVNHYGNVIEVPKGFTVLDYVCQEHSDLLEKMTGALVDEKRVELKTELKNGNRVQIITKGIINHEHWEDYVSKPSSKQKIKKMNEVEKKN